MWSTGTEDPTVHDAEVVDGDGTMMIRRIHGSGSTMPGGGPLGGGVRVLDTAGDEAWTTAADSQPTFAEHQLPPDYSDLPPPPIGVSRLPPPSSGAFGVGTPGAAVHPGPRRRRRQALPHGRCVQRSAGGAGRGRARGRGRAGARRRFRGDSRRCFAVQCGGSHNRLGTAVGAAVQGRVAGTGTADGSQSDPWDAWRDWDSPSAAHAEQRPAPSGKPVVPDPHDFDKAVARLRHDEIERARVSLTVCGALLDRSERVRSVVTGQMLGRSAAVVLTDRRVLVVNERRWRPIVDIYELGPELNVRGRHDGHVAALSFSDDTRLSMVDGIGEVELAVTLARATREPSGSDERQSHEF